MEEYEFFGKKSTGRKAFRLSSHQPLDWKMTKITFNFFSRNGNR